MSAGERFWETKSLEQMNASEWESLCDGCARCCLIKLEDEDTGEILFTRVACALLNLCNCRCSDYFNRQRRVPDCVPLTAENIHQIGWLPATCAYRLVREGKPLYDWHPLISGDNNSVQDAGISVRGKVLSEKNVHEDGYEQHIIHWVD